MKTLKELVAIYGQEETACRSGRAQPGICKALHSDRVVYGHVVGESIVLFELKRIDKTDVEVDQPRLVMPKNKGVGLKNNKQKLYIFGENTIERR